MQPICVTIGHLHHVLRASCFAALVLAGAVPAWGQDAADEVETDAIEDVLVTGQKRTETLLESDVAVTVMTEEFIDEARIRDLRRIDDLVPNVQFNETAQLSSVFVTIRGIESNPYIVNRAALYIDGIPFRELSNAVLSQIDSIEVLRGPQSTLYGDYGDFFNGGREVARFESLNDAPKHTDERYPSGLAFEHFLFGADGTFYAPLDATPIIGVELETGL